MTNPGNTVRVHSRNGGRASVYEANMWAQKLSGGLFSGNGVLQNTPSVNMNVKVGGTTANPDVVIASNPSGFKIALDLVSQQTILLAAPASNSRIASIVAYCDDLSINSVDNTTTGSQSSCGLIIVYGATSASPTAPTDANIRSAITSDGATGSQACYAVLTNITLTSATTTITQTMIDAGKFLAQFDASVVLQDNSIPFKKTAGIWWEEVGRTTLGTGADSISVTGLPVRKYLHIIVQATGTGVVAMNMTFNNDSTSTYAKRFSTNGGSDSTVVSQSNIALTNDNNAAFLMEFDVMNLTTSEKNVLGFTIISTAGAANAPARVEIAAKWANTVSQITRIDLNNTGAGDIAAGSSIVVLGHD